MRKKKEEITRREKIIKKIVSFIEEAKLIRSNHALDLWVKRIISFIDNEFPRKKKYQKIKLMLENLIIRNNKSYNPPILDFEIDVVTILVELRDTFNLDNSPSSYINLHPKVREHSLQLFRNKHYAEAIFEAVKGLNIYVKKKASITDKDLSDAMAKAFNENNPIIKLNNLITRSEIDEQKGFKFLYMGAMIGIRNPKAHENVEQEDRNRTLEYLAFLSLLFRRAEEGRLSD